MNRCYIIVLSTKRFIPSKVTYNGSEKSEGGFMAVTVRKVDYFYVKVGDKPGQGYKIISLLKENEIDLVAFTAFPSARGQAQLDFIPKDPARLQSVAASARIKLTGPKKAFLVQGEDRVGAIAELHKKLADARINVYAGNGVADGTGRFGYIFWVKPKKFDEAAKVLGAD